MSSTWNGEHFKAVHDGVSLLISLACAINLQWYVVRWSVE